MSDSDENLDHETYVRLRFDSETRSRLYKRLYDALQAKGRLVGHDDIDFEVEVMIGCMEGYAELLPMYDKWKPETQQRRKERINAMANHLDGIIEQIKALDSPALGYCLSKGFGEIAKVKDLSNPYESSFHAILDAEEIQENNFIEGMTAFALGVRKAAKTLPQHSGNTSGKDCDIFTQPPRLATASAMERLFIDQGIDYTITETGLAAECLRAIYTLGGLEIERVGHWLKSARDHKDSQANFLKRLQKRQDG